jgi:hypothetical protein
LKTDGIVVATVDVINITHAAVATASQVSGFVYALIITNYCQNNCILSTP